jgi:dTDP-4-dehydrorhamnose 3,5-epimerase
MQGELPVGVGLSKLRMHSDARGCVTELWRHAWHESPKPLQWNVVSSDANVLRGVHVHKLHWDYLFLVSGEMQLGLHDMRVDSPSHRKSALVRLSADELTGVVIPPGVAHGFYYARPSTHAYAVSHYWNPDDELGCHWDEPDLRLDWPCKNPVLSERDREPRTYAELRAALGSWRYAGERAE